MTKTKISENRRKNDRNFKKKARTSASAYSYNINAIRNPTMFNKRNARRKKKC